jgi:hypothetical protein
MTKAPNPTTATVTDSPPTPQALPGAYLRRAGSLVLYLTALAIPAGALLVSLIAWGLAWSQDAIPGSTSLLVALCLIQALYLAVSLLAARLTWVRAVALSYPSAIPARHHALPVVAALLGLGGELLALSWLLVASCAGILFAFAGDALVIRLWGEEAAWLSAVAALRWSAYLAIGLGCILAGLLGAWLSLLASYALAELLGVATDIAGDTQAIRARLRRPH